jgi:hypothetical protein
MPYPRIIPDAQPPAHTTSHAHTLRHQVLIAHRPFPLRGGTSQGPLCRRELRRLGGLLRS